MLENLFWISKRIHKKYSFNNEEVVIMDTETGENNSTIENNLILKEIRGRKALIIKCLSYEPNIRHYNHIAKNEKTFINKAIEAIRETDKELKIYFVVSKELHGEFKGINGTETVVTAVNKDLLSEKGIINKISKNNKLINPLIIDLIDLYYIGAELSEQNNVIVSIFGDCIEKNSLLKVKSGTTIREIFKFFNGDEGKLKSIISGGILSGMAQYDINKKVDKTVRSLVFIRENNDKNKVASNCIRCGKCLRICPIGLNPILLSKQWELKDNAEFLKNGGYSCNGCGICSYECPANIQLVHKINTAKTFFKESEIERGA